MFKIFKNKLLIILITINFFFFYYLYIYPFYLFLTYSTYITCAPRTLRVLSVGLVWRLFIAASSAFIITVDT